MPFASIYFHSFFLSLLFFFNIFFGANKKNWLRLLLSFSFFVGWLPAMFVSVLFFFTLYLFHIFEFFSNFDCNRRKKNWNKTRCAPSCSFSIWCFAASFLIITEQSKKYDESERKTLFLSLLLVLIHRLIVILLLPQYSLNGIF